MPANAIGVSVTFDQTITFGNLIEVGSIIGGGIFALAMFKGTVLNMRDDLTDLKAEMKKVGDVLIQMAVHNQRLTNVEQDVRELRHGHGFVQRDTNGEYPR